VSGRKTAFNGCSAPAKGALFYDAIYAAQQLLRHADGLKAIIALTDGEDNGSEVAPRQIIGAALGRNHAIYIIGLGEDLNTESLRYIAEATMGAAFFSRTPQALDEIYRQIAHALHSHYVLTYQSQSMLVKGINLLAVEVNYGEVYSQDTIALPKIQ
jgi:hypothetical protein